MADGVVDLKNVDDVIATLSRCVRPAWPSRPTSTSRTAASPWLQPDPHAEPEQGRPQGHSGRRGRPGQSHPRRRRHAAGPGGRRSDQERHRARHRRGDLRQYRADVAVSRAAPEDRDAAAGSADPADCPVDRPGDHQPRSGEDAQAPDDPAADRRTLTAPETQQPPTGTGRFEVALANGMKLFGYTTEANKTLVLSLNSQLVDAVRHGGPAEHLGAQRRPLAGCSGDPVADDQQAGPDQRRRGAPARRTERRSSRRMRRPQRGEDSHRGADPGLPEDHYSPADQRSTPTASASA